MGVYGINKRNTCLTQLLRSLRPLMLPLSQMITENSYLYSEMYNKKMGQLKRPIIQQKRETIYLMYNIRNTTECDGHHIGMWALATLQMVFYDNRAALWFREKDLVRFYVRTPWRMLRLIWRHCSDNILILGKNSSNLLLLSVHREEAFCRYFMLVWIALPVKIPVENKTNQGFYSCEDLF